jgi:hypothetical protein
MEAMPLFLLEKLNPHMMGFIRIRKVKEFPRALSPSNP